MANINDTQALYQQLRKRKSDYVIIGEVRERLIYLQNLCPTQTEQLGWYLGGPLYWLIHWRANKSSDKKRGISRTDRKIIQLLNDYELTIEPTYCLLVEKIK